MKPSRGTHRYQVTQKRKELEKKDDKKKAVLIALIALILLTSFPVQAINVSFSSIDGAADRDMYLYQGGVFVGLYNTSSTAINITADTEFVFRPQTSSLLEDPPGFLSTAYTYISTNAIYLLVLGAILGIVFRGRFR